jgi:hypothetical protein
MKKLFFCIAALAFLVPTLGQAQVSLTPCPTPAWCQGPIHVTKVIPHGLPDDDQWEHTVIVAHTKTTDFVFDCRSAVIHSEAEARKYPGAHDFCSQLIPGLEFTPSGSIVSDMVMLEYPDKRKAPDGSPYAGVLHIVSMEERGERPINDKNTKNH